MNGVETRHVKPDEEGMRLDRWFSVHYPDIGHGRLQKLLRTGQVRLDGARAKANTRVKAGQAVRIPPVGARTSAAEMRSQRPLLTDADAEYIRSLVIYSDEWLVALAKPPGLAVQGGTGTTRHVDALVDALAVPGGERPRLVHRLDRDTSGVLVLARTRAAAAVLARLFRSRRLTKVYWALVVGVPKPAEGTIDASLRKAGHAGDQRIVVAERDEEGAQHAVTRYRTVSRAGKRFAWLEVEPETGRTHQIRVHLAAIGHPVVGDGKYGGRTEVGGDGIARTLHLHARRLEFPHPKDGRLIRIEAPLPEHMKRTWDLLGLDEREAEETR